jgi:alpha,alpha-trehalase
MDLSLWGSPFSIYMKPHFSTKLRHSSRIIVIVFVALFLPAASLAQGAGPAVQTPAQGHGLEPILGYISTAWNTLTRSMTECQSIVDPKIKVAPVLYLPANFPEPATVKKMETECGVHVEALPIEINHLGEIDTSKIQPHGLLYLENKYVVPGGRFNEMYGWDSYFIIRGLLRAGHVELARGMVDNFFFEIEHYGAMLNANRTYYLTRSQPPFLSSMFIDVYKASHKDGSQDNAALQRAYTDLEKDYEMWIHDPHLAGDTGLSRYFDFGDGPPAEAVQDESGFYRKVSAYFFFHPSEADGYLVPKSEWPNQHVAGSGYTLQVCDAAYTMARPDCDKAQQFKLSSDYYKGDRSMRESGFDVSFRFGPFGSGTHHYAAVCLNSLLYKNEKDLEQISRWLDRRGDAEKWSKRAEARQKLVTHYLWNAERGLFVDFNFQTKQQSSYLYATTFYPLWAGLATPGQAKAVVGNLKGFEQPGGLPMSTQDTSAQWDLPYGWGNIEMIAIDALRRYGFNSEADRISYNFLSTVAENFRRDGTIKEKYNVVSRSSEAHVELGYQMNVVGFGWTNGAFLELLHGLPKEMVDRLAKEQEQPLPPAN